MHDATLCEKYLNEAMSGKPKKGDVILTTDGRKLKIATISRGFVYADEPGKMERFVVGDSDVKPDPKGLRQWVEMLDGKSYYDFK
jgi:hypothetical protein